MEKLKLDDLDLSVLNQNLQQLEKAFTKEELNVVSKSAIVSGCKGGYCTGGGTGW